MFAQNRFGKTPCEWAQQDRQGHWMATQATLYAACACLHAATACRGPCERGSAVHMASSKSEDAMEDARRTEPMALV